MLLWKNPKDMVVLLPHAAGFGGCSGQKEPALSLDVEKLFEINISPKSREKEWEIRERREGWVLSKGREEIEETNKFC